MFLFGKYNAFFLFVRSLAHELNQQLFFLSIDLGEPNMYFVFDFLHLKIIISVTTKVLISDSLLILSTHLSDHNNYTLKYFCIDILCISLITRCFIIINIMDDL